MKRVLIFFAILAIFLPVILNAKKKAKKNQLPLSVEPELYCNSCQAVVRESLKKLRHRTSESDVFESLEHICDMRNLYTYDHSPPDMVKGCLAFIENWQETVEKELMKRKNNEEVEETICMKKTKVCVGIEPKGTRKEKVISGTDDGPEIKVVPEKSKINENSEKIDL